VVEAVDGADVGENSLDHIWREGGARSRLLHELGTEHLQRGEEENRGGEERR